MRRHIVSKFFLAFFVFGVTAADDNEIHVWTSTDGTYSVEASLVESEYDRQRKATLFILKKKDGNIVKVSADRLSEESRKLAVRILSQRRTAARQKERKRRHETAQELRAKRALETARLQGFAREAGWIIPKQTPHGSYLQYIPRRPPLGIIVVVHGTLGENDDTGLETVRTFIKRWVPLAEKQGAIILAPAFDQENFGGREGPGGGYRGLFGREIGADEFVNSIVDQYQLLLPTTSKGKFMLYGHSAGGQFASRYVVKHPDRIIAAVISAAGSFAFPDPDVPWAGGMGRRTQKMRWGLSDDWKQFDFQPNPDGWLKAAVLPITVVVGSQDIEENKPAFGQKGTNHVERARNWVEDMNALAGSNGSIGNVRLVVVEGVGHSSSGLTPVCQAALWRK